MNKVWVGYLLATPRIAQIKNAQMEEGTNTSTIDYRNAPKGSFVYRVFEILEKEGADKTTINKVVDLVLTPCQSDLSYNLSVSVKMFVVS